MTAPVTVIIAARNEEGRVAAAVDSAFAAGAAEVIVADGASEDRTREIAAARGATVIHCEAMRSRQFNDGAAAAAHEALIFLHADTVLPPGAASAVADALGSGAWFGGFRIRFEEPLWRMRCVAFMVNLRTRLTRCPWGDQAQFITKSRFLEGGGYREIPLMEDYELAVRMKRTSCHPERSEGSGREEARGMTLEPPHTQVPRYARDDTRSARPLILPLTVTTSGRRFLTQGVVKTTVKNWTIVAAWRAGVSPDSLRRWYRTTMNDER